jgi:2-C-methyl-D-erythritol 2,4-cyclodiphosphate synthase
MRIGFGYDSHRLVEGRRLVVGGVEIPHTKGLLGHSDGDVLLHAITDSIIGALGLGDIGRHFPDTDPAYKDADSAVLLRRVVELVAAEGYEVTWADCTVVIEEPKLAPHIEDMERAIRAAGVRGVNVKAKTDEAMGFVGTGQGAAAYAVCLLGPLAR